MDNDASQPGAPLFLERIWEALEGHPDCLARLGVSNRDQQLPGVFAVSGLAAAAVGAAGVAVAELLAATRAERPAVHVDQRLASMWFKSSLRPEGWEPPPTWDDVAGDYACRDGWIRLHTNAPHHRAAALAVLGAAGDKASVARAVQTWRAHDLETAIVARGGCAAQMHSLDAWATHPQGQAVQVEPLLSHTLHPCTGTPYGLGADQLGIDRVDTHRAMVGARAVAGDPAPAVPCPPASRPLQGVRVLDLTRIVAGPVATRFLAGYGAQVLRIDPVDWDELAAQPEFTLGKRCARLDLRSAEGKARFEQLLADADVLVHGYRADALEQLGLGAQRRRAINPAVVDISLDAYGWSGPWAHRRGFDSLVQMSCGIADAGMRRQDKTIPTPLPVQALDHATGYIMAAAALRGLTRRLTDGVAVRSRASLARTAHLLAGAPAPQGTPLADESAADLSRTVEQTVWGPARRLHAPLEIDGVPMSWDRPAGPLGTAQPEWE